MKHHKVALLLAAIVGFCGISSKASAQLVTYETISDWAGGVYTLNGNVGYSQTFSQITAIESLTYRFAASAYSTLPVTLDYYFTEWNATTNRAVGAAPIMEGTFILPSSGNAMSSEWTFQSLGGLGGGVLTYDWQFNMGLTTDPTKSYAMVLRTATNTNSVGLATASYSNAESDGFTLGGAYSTYGVTDYSNLLNTSAGPALGASFNDWGFSQIVVAPYVTPVPEPRTTAAIIAAIFVCAMVLRRKLKERQAALVPVQA